MGTIEQPMSSTDAGTHTIHKGRFAGQTSAGAYSVPYEISVPKKANKGNGSLLFEPPHFINGPLVRDGALGREYVFGQGYSHASVGYSNQHRQLLDPNPGFETRIRGQVVAPLPPGGPSSLFTTDREIFADFAAALRANSGGLLSGVSKFYSAGISDSGLALYIFLREPYANGVFDLTVPFNVRPFTRQPVAAGSGRIIYFNTEHDFNTLRPEADDGDPSIQRSYAAAGCPHVCDTPLSRAADPAVAGTTPLDYTPFLKAVVEAGDRWVTKGAEPPPSLLFKRGPLGPDGRRPVERDALQNALGGIRHPALEVGEATFIAQRQTGNLLYGDYRNAREIGTSGFFPDFHSYRKAFERAAKDLRQAGFISQADERDWIDKSRLDPSATFTLNYRRGRFPVAADVRGARRLGDAEIDALSAQGQFETASA